MAVKAQINRLADSEFLRQNDAHRGRLYVGHITSWLCVDECMGFFITAAISHLRNLGAYFTGVRGQWNTDHARHLLSSTSRNMRSYTEQEEEEAVALIC